jgi:UDP-N-acetylmuramyl pentapeptide phosphotransferase/UDP-N-acetylglucosamine-1-phosphate transferase
MDKPNHRSSHKKSTPSMAGVSFFLTLIFMLNAINSWDIEGIGINLIAATGVMFAIGLKDDLVLSTPKAKIGGEILAICFVLFCNCLGVSSIEGFLGITYIPSWLSYLIIALMILTIVNAYNMIDGIDGLASVIGIAIFAVYGLIFYAAGLDFYFLLCLCLIGVLLGYLRYNISSTRKIFMGDTGSLVIGFCIGFMSLKFLSMDVSLLSDYAFKGENKLIVIGAIFFIPLFDTLRVIGVRLLNKKSPFHPDNNHIHHMLISTGLTHFKASLLLCFLNLGIAITLILLATIFNSYEMIGFMMLYFAFFLLVFYKLKINIGNRIRYKHNYTFNSVKSNI